MKGDFNMPARQFVSPDAREVLAQATLNGSSLKLNSGQLERSLYEEVNEVLTRLGGKWKGGKTAAHLFDTVDAAKLRDCLDIVLATGLMPAKNPNAFYFTPKPVQKRMLELFKAMIRLKSGMRFLEPSAVKGHLYFGWDTPSIPTRAGLYRNAGCASRLSRSTRPSENI